MGHVTMSSKRIRQLCPACGWRGIRPSLTEPCPRCGGAVERLNWVTTAMPSPSATPTATDSSPDGTPQRPACIWLYDENHRVYPDRRDFATGPIWRKHWVKHQVVGETRLMWTVSL